jgi:endonuclease YncB( thermonuclease family)
MGSTLFISKETNMAAAKKKDVYIRNAKVIRVIDGDTAEFNVDLGCDININMTCRFNGINAPETSTKEGKESKAWLENKLTPELPVVIQTVADKKEKYGRYLADVYLPNSTTSINDQLVKEGLAVPYKP